MRVVSRRGSRLTVLYLGIYLLFERSNTQGSDLSDCLVLVSLEQLLLKSPPKPEGKPLLICLPL